MPASQSTETPLVSVVIASYNSAATLPATLDSVLGQTYPRVEIVVVDDGSTDETPEILRRYADSVRSIRKPNGGLASARNAGCEASLGEFIALLDADDLCVPERLSVQSALLRQRSEVLLCSSEFSSFDQSGTLAERDATNYYSALGAARGGLEGLFGQPAQILLPDHKAGASEPISVTVYSGPAYPQVAYGSFIHPPTVMFRRLAWEKCGRFDETIRNGCDWDWITRVCRAGLYAYIDRPLLRYRRSANQLSGRNHKLQVYVDILGNLQRFLRDDPSLAGLRMQRCIGEAELNVAEALVGSGRTGAMAPLWRAARQRGIDGRWLKLLIKALLPNQARNLIRASLRGSTSP